jgi:hypothetical protein
MPGELQRFLTWKSLSYKLEEATPDMKEYCLRPTSGGWVISDRPPSFLLRGKGGALYGLFPADLKDAKPEDPIIFKAYNLNKDHNYWAHPFGKAGFELVNGILTKTCQLRISPVRHKQVKIMKKLYMPPKTGAF